MFRANMVDLPIIIGSIETAEERTQLERGLRGMGATLEDVEVVSIDECEERGLFQNDRFLQYIGQMGFRTADEMREAAERRAGQGNVVVGRGNNDAQRELPPQGNQENLLEGWE